MKYSSLNTFLKQYFTVSTANTNGLIRVGQEATERITCRDPDDSALDGADNKQSNFQPLGFDKLLSSFTMLAATYVLAMLIGSAEILFAGTAS